MSMIFKFHRRTSKPAAAAIPNVGDAYKGGYFVSPMAYPTGTVATHHLIISPKALGETTKTFGGAGTRYGAYHTFGRDGLIESNWWQNLSSSNFPAVNWARTRNIGGYTDWYLPSIEELEVMYRKFKPSTAPNAPQTRINTTSIPNFNNRYDGANGFTLYQTTLTNFQISGSECMAGTYYLTPIETNAHSINANIFNMGSYNGALTSVGKGGTYGVRVVRKVPV